jgi:pimeloyl-ACP methyl ester carboxylesterase
MKPIVLIHGANSTSKSFKYLSEYFPDRELLFVEYNCDNGLRSNIELIFDFINQLDEPVDIVAHSLGGIIALAVHQKGALIDRIVTLSAPFGGSQAAIFLSWIYPRNQLFRDIRPSCSVLQEIHNRPITIPVLSIITHGGAIPAISGPNDGVVSVASQISLDGPEYLSLDLNHFEVLLSSYVVEEIQSFLGIDDGCKRIEQQS